jgi:hypothetical protein
MAVEVHVYTRGHQPATRYKVDVGDVKPFWIKSPPNRMYRTNCCRRLRRARNLSVQVYYDATYYWCNKGTGCKVHSPARRSGTE